MAAKAIDIIEIGSRTEYQGQAGSRCLDRCDHTLYKERFLKTHFVRLDYLKEKRTNLVHSF